MARQLDRAYGPAAEAQAVMNVLEETGTLEEIAAFATASLPQPADA
jgi:CRISPR system Cascade subunit CasC